MADHHDEEAACPKCGGTITFTLWENLVAEKYPEAAEKLMRGELFAYECPHCHATGNGYYPLRFTDMTAKVMVDYPATTDLRAVQINGKMRGTIKIAKDADKETAIAAAKEAVADKLTGNIVKEIYVPGRIVNIVQK